MPEIGRLAALIEHIHRTQVHVSAIFPEDTDETCTVTAGDVADTFGDWVELADNNAVKFASKFDDGPGHIVGIAIEECSLKDVRYLLEIAYGDDKTVIVRSRFMKVNVKLDVGHQTRVRSLEIPSDEEIYYRLKCETADATAEIHFRYYVE